jgi:hypothetical protein
MTNAITALSLLATAAMIWLGVHALVAGAVISLGGK